MKIKSIYLIASLRNPEVVKIGNKIRELGIEAFDDWSSPGPEADDFWKTYSEARGQTYKEALNSWSAKHVFEFDKYHLDRCDAALMICPAGKSAHLELGYTVGKGKPGWVLLDETAKLPDNWNWAIGLYEGEGSISYQRNRHKEPKQLVMSITSTDRDVIERFHNIVKVGNFQGPYFNLGNNLIKKAEKFKEQWRWSVYKKEDVLYVIRSLWNGLSKRRKQQITNTLLLTNIELKEGPSAHEFRWDCMLQFATGIYDNVDEFIEMLKDGRY